MSLLDQWHPVISDMGLVNASPSRTTGSNAFASGIQGSDPFPVVSQLARPSRYAPSIWERYAPDELGGAPPRGYRRSIASANDGGRWIFDQSGEPYPFEEIGAYSSLSKREHRCRSSLKFGARQS